jgi:Ca2+-binding RTX toxin-like protein
MVTQIFAGNTIGSGHTVDLGTTDDVFVSNGATVGSTDGTAIVGAGGDHRATILGTVFGDQLGIDLAGGKVTVAAGAYVGGGYGVSLGERSTVINHGSIWGSIVGVQIGGSPYSSDPAVGGWSIDNTGQIDSDGVGAIRRLDDSTLTIKVKNSGVISGVINAYQGDTGDGIDIVVNTGTMKGSVVLGSQDDLYDGRLGTLDGTLSGDDGNDTLLCGAGDNTLYGGAGIDVMQGGAGNDTYGVDNALDTVDESVAGSGGIDTIGSTISFSLVASAHLLGAIENLQLGVGNINGTGNALNNSLVGNTGNNVLDGGAGADTMIGYIGNDTYVVDNAGDIVDESYPGSNGIDRVQSSISFSLTNSATVLGAVEQLQLLGSAAINGTGNALDNVLTGNGGNNMLSGLAGNDTLTGGAGNDVLTGGAGKDNLTGGAGADTFVYTTIGDSPVGGSTTSDAITDFSHAQGDKIDLHGIDANTGVAGDQAFSFIGAAGFTHHAGELRAVSAGGVTSVYGDVNGDGTADFQIRLSGTITLVAGDFVL